MKILGMISGIGSMMIGAKEQGYEVVGNIEWRPYYHTGTFERNFPDSFMVKTLKDLTAEQETQCEDLDIIIGHTECGNFSELRVNRNTQIDKGDKGDIPEFIEAVQKFKPKFFVMDNLPKSLLVADWKYYSKELPDYEFHFEWISNHGYGNIQKNRKRLFVIGSRKELGFYFIPSEFEHKTTILDRMKEIAFDAENNELLEKDAIYNGWARYHFDKEYIPKTVEENRMTLAEFQEIIKEYPNNLSFSYYNKKGEQKFKIGYSKTDVDRHALVLSGGAACYDNHFRSDTLYPFTIRERAKIQGCPDDFVFLPTGVTTTTREYSHLIKQTGKFMPVEFCSFITGYIQEFLEKRDFWNGHTQKRTINPNVNVDKNKFEFCQFIGYTAQDNVCEFCGSKKYCETNKELF